jgi:UDP-glucose 4-epimerase
MKILVTGATGFIGSRFLKYMNSQGHSIYGISSHKSTNKNIYNVPMSNLSKLNYFFKKNKFDIVIHLASHIDETNPFTMFEDNCRNTINILECCKSNNIKKLVYASSHAVYGVSRNPPIEEKNTLNPITNYALSKLISENICKMYHYSYGLQIIILRITSVYGIGQPPERLIPTLIDDGLNKQKITLHKYSNGFQIMDLIHVDDVCRAISLAISAKAKFGIFNIATGKLITVKRISKLLSKIIVIKSVHTKKITKKTNHFLYDVSAAYKYLKFRPHIFLNESVLKEIVISRKSAISPQ